MCIGGGSRLRRVFGKRPAVFCHGATKVFIRRRLNANPSRFWQGCRSTGQKLTKHLPICLTARPRQNTPLLLGRSKHPSSDRTPNRNRLVKTADAIGHRLRHRRPQSCASSTQRWGILGAHAPQAAQRSRHAHRARYSLFAQRRGQGPGRQVGPGQEDLVRARWRQPRALCRVAARRGSFRPQRALHLSGAWQARMLEVPRADDGRGLWHSVSGGRGLGQQGRARRCARHGRRGPHRDRHRPRQRHSHRSRWAACRPRSATTCASAAATNP